MSLLSVDVRAAKRNLFRRSISYPGVQEAAATTEQFIKKGQRTLVGGELELFNQIKYAARIRGISFELTKEYLLNLLDKQHRRCALTGRELSLRGRSVRHGTASVDRIDSKKGYTTKNVHWVHKDVNLAKRDSSLADFLALCKEVTAHCPI